MNTGREPLTQEERELAARLARLGLPEGPSPALDARILSAAHGAVLRKPAQRPHRRWPLAMGAAASVALALGIAWQLRPAQETEQAYSEADFVRAPRASGPSAAEALPIATETVDDSAFAAPVPPLPAIESAQDAAADSAAPAEPARAVAREPAIPQEEERRARAEPQAQDNRDAFPAEEKQAAPDPSAAEPAAPPPPAPPAGPPAEEAPIVFDLPEPAPAPVAAPSPAANAGAARDAQMQQRQQALEKSAAAKTVATEEAAAAASVRSARDNEGFSDAELDHQPPASADSPQVQRAWLQRIREMLAEGNEDGARDSLTEFKRRYPRYALPDDLQALLP